MIRHLASASRESNALEVVSSPFGIRGKNKLGKSYQFAAFVLAQPFQDIVNGEFGNEMFFLTDAKTSVCSYRSCKVFLKCTDLAAFQMLLKI